MLPLGKKQKQRLYLGASGTRWVLRLLLLTIFLTVLWLLARLVDVGELVRQFLSYIQGLGVWAPVLFICAYIVASLIFFPGVILTLGAGIVFGLLQGTLLVVTGATAGAACAFLISRYLAREWVIKKFGTVPRFAALDRATEQEGWKIVGLVRLSPVFPFIPTNFAFGLTRVPFWHFVFATFFGLFPVTMLFVYLGVLAGDLAKIGNEPVAPGKFKWVLAGVVLVSTTVVTIVISRIALKALSGTYEKPRK